MHRILGAPPQATLFPWQWEWIAESYFFTLHLRDTSRLKLSIQGGSQKTWVCEPCLKRYGEVLRLILVPHSSQRLFPGI